MKIYDISRRINEDMVVYKNRDNKRIRRTVVSDYETGNHYESRLDLDMHTGTHVDAPLHMLKDSSTIEMYDLDLFIGKVKVFDLTGIKPSIRIEHIKDLPIEKGERIIFKTDNSYDDHYNPEFVYLEEDAADYLKNRGIKSFGIDAMSVERDKSHHPSHKILLGHGIGIIEDLQLAQVEEGEYFLSALPLNIQGAEASPVRAVLIKDLSL